MLLGDPPPTPFDFQFEIFRIPVRVSALFWVLPFIFGASMGHPFYILVSALVIFTGVLVHELGHALVMRYYGISPRIALTMMGGYATSNELDVWNLAGQQRRSPNQQIIISAAGPIAGFALAGIVVGAVIALGGWINFGFVYYVLPAWDIQLVSGETFQPQYENGANVPTNVDLIHSLIYMALFVNIYWGIMNLMPVYPLDGGQIAREVMVKNDPREGFRNSLWLSVYAGAIIGILGFAVLRMPFLAIMFGIFAYQSYQMIQRMDGRGFGGPW